MSELDFIKDSVLRKTLEDSIEYVYALYEETKQDSQKPLYREETYRVIVLYAVSAIEAVLLYYYKARGEEMVQTEYKFVQALPLEYVHKGRPSAPVVVAVQDKQPKRDHQIGLYDLAIFFRSKKLMREQTAKDILELNEMRNTFHFAKSRSRICDTGQVEQALQLLVHTLQNAPKSLDKKS